MTSRGPQLKRVYVGTIRLNKKYQNLRGADATVGLLGIQLIEIFW